MPDATTTQRLHQIDTNLTRTRAAQLRAAWSGDTDRADHWGREVDRLLDLRRAVDAGLVTLKSGTPG